MKFQSKK